jgi:predicted metal-dependent peptidase
MTVDIRLTRARSQLVMDAPFFGSLIMRMNLTASTALKDKTMATDGTDIWYHPAFPDEVSELELLGILVHELFHCILGHHVRRGDRDPKRWNIACDYVVNLMVIAAGFMLPKWALLDRQYVGLNAEQVYRLLEEQDEQQQQQQEERQQQQDEGSDDDGHDSETEDSSDADDSSDDGEESDASDQGDGDEAQDDEEGDGLPDDQEGDGDQDQDGKQGQGSGDGENQSGDSEGAGNATHDGDPNSQGDPGRCGEILDAAPPHDKAALSEAEGEWEIAVRQAVNIAKKQGDMPGFINEIIEHLNDPQVSWHDVLDRFVDPSNTKDFSWMNPSRRMMAQGYYTPGVVTDGVSHVGMVVDSSGSVDTGLLAKIGADVQGALDTGRIDRLTVIFCDTRVTKHDEYSTGDVIDWTVPGRGGTAFRPAFEWLNENAPDIQCAIYLTDMDCADYGIAPAYPVLFMGYGDPRALKAHMARAPFGECIEVN